MPVQDHHLNERAARLCDEIAAQAEELGVCRQRLSCGTTVFDFGVDMRGSEAAGLWLARVCLADLAEVEIVPSEPWPLVMVATDQPVAACLASQYAGWEIKGENFFAMGSGPMRAAAGRERLFDDIGCRERTSECVGVLEAAKLPPEAVCREIAAKCGIDAGRLTLLVAPTSSAAGTLQVVARSVEAALHKLHELGFHLSRIERGSGSAPLPPVAAGDLAAVGVANDAILCGGEVTLWVRGDDRSLEELGPRVPSSASPDYGRPFAEVLAAYDNDFYRIDPLLFSAAAVTFVNLDTGLEHHFGQTNPALLRRSFSSD